MAEQPGGHLLLLLPPLFFPRLLLLLLLLLLLPLVPLALLLLLALLLQPWRRFGAHACARLAEKPKRGLQLRKALLESLHVSERVIAAGRRLWPLRCPH